MQLTDNHINLFFAFESIYNVLLDSKIKNVEFNIRNEYFLNVKFKMEHYSFCLSYCSLDNGTLILVYHSYTCNNTITKYFDSVSDFTTFFKDAFLNVNG